MTHKYATPELADLGSVVTTTGAANGGTHGDGAGVKLTPNSTNGSTAGTETAAGTETSGEMT